jgi:hypothetical protein
MRESDIGASQEHILSMISVDSHIWCSTEKAIVIYDPAVRFFLNVSVNLEFMKFIEIY